MFTMEPFQNALLCNKILLKAKWIIRPHHIFFFSLVSLYKVWLGRGSSFVISSLFVIWKVPLYYNWGKKLCEIVSLFSPTDFFLHTEGMGWGLKKRRKKEALYQSDLVLYYYEICSRTRNQFCVKLVFFPPYKSLCWKDPTCICVIKSLISPHLPPPPKKAKTTTRQIFKK